MRLLVGRQCAAFLDVVPLREASTTTRRRRVLGDEHWMAFPRCLLAVVLWLGGRQSLRDEIPRVRDHRRQAFVVEIRFLFGAESETLTELRARQS